MNLATNQEAYGRYKEFRSDRIGCQCRLADEWFRNNVPATERARRRGANDRYYGRAYNPSVLTSRLGHTRPCCLPSEFEAYKNGWDNEEERKDWRE